jgi:ADP-heptose:LPS heptosyltransferase
MKIPGIEGVDCKQFTGYKPCHPGTNCLVECQENNKIGTRILIINLDAMGDVLMTTAQLPGIKRAYPESQIIWITRANAFSLLLHNPYIDKVYKWDDISRMIISQQHYDIVLSADKSIESCAFVSSLQATEVRGFTLSRRGQIIPANPEAVYNYQMGLDDELKFKQNTRTGQEILAETWKLPYQRDEYTLMLTEQEEAFCEMKIDDWKLKGKTVVGFNTGCSPLYPNKKMTVEQHIQLIDMLSVDESLTFLLLGGPEDTERNDEIAMELVHLSTQVIATPTREGLRRGICYENLADILITGDTFGMHLGIALKKQILVWFGVSCRMEIDLYERGDKFFQEDLECSPCWKNICPFNRECISGIDLDAMADEVRVFAANHKPQLTAAT